MSIIDILWREIEAAWWVIVGVIALGFGMWLSDTWTGFIDQKVWKKKD